MPKNAPSEPAAKAAPKQSRPARVPLVSAAVRTLSILEQLGRRNAIGLEELSRELGLAKPTLYRFLLTLQELGYARRDSDDRWAVTLRMFNMGSRALDHMDLLSAAKPTAEALAAGLGETVHMGVLDGDSAVYVLKIESRYTIRMYSRVGRRMPLYCTAIGKVLLAFSPRAESAALLDSIRLVAFTPNTRSTRPALDEELERIRREGFGRDDEEHEEGIRCIAAPVFDYTGAVVAAISASWPRFRFDTAFEPEWADTIRTAAARISSILGFGTA
jgi:IclR family KDG regulon transcriptional repressor